MITKLNPHGLMARLYRNFYNTGVLPNNLCPYFWKLIFAIIALPFVYPALIINYLDEPFYYEKWYYDEYKSFRGGGNMKIAWGLPINIGLLFVGAWFSKLVYPNIFEYMAIWKYYVNGLIIVVSLVLFFKLLAFAIRKLFPAKPAKEMNEEEWEAHLIEEDKKWELKHQKKRERKERWQRSFVYLTWRAFVAWKDRVCPQIEWKIDKK